MLCAAAPAGAVTFDITWGKDVINDAPTGPEVCTAAASCKQGITGTGQGEFEQIAGVAADARNIYVLEAGSAPHVSKFDLDGHFVMSWGSLGSGAGQIATSPRDIAVSQDGHVYVADFNNRRIDKWDTNGNFVKAWGKDVGGAGVNQCTTTCAAGGSSTGPGDEFVGPNAIGVDGLGNVLVADETAARVQKFTSDGGFLFTLGKSVVTAGGGGNGEKCTIVGQCHNGLASGQGGEFDSPTGIAGDEAGQIYVVDEGNQRLDNFDQNGTFTFGVGKNVNLGIGVADRCITPLNCQGGLSGPQGGQFDNPAGVASDLHGSVYVTDSGGNRVQKLDTSGTFQEMWGLGVNNGSVFEECTTAVSCILGDGGTLGGEMTNPMAVASDANGSIYVGDTDNLRVQRFLDGALAKPALIGFATAHRANDNAPKVVGTAPAGTTVQLFTDPACTATPLATGSAGTFSNPGIAVSVPDDSATSFYANDTDGSFTSRCAGLVVYTEDSTGPDTTIDTAPSGTITTGTPTVTFHASEAGATFQCRFDAEAFANCLGPLGTDTPVLPLAAGSHTFEVRALDDLGNPDATPASASFTVAPTLPRPVQGKLVNAIPVTGVVLVKVKGLGKVHGAAASGFVPLETVGRQVPVGSTFDTSKGTVRLTAATNPKGTKTQAGNFGDGLFRFTQTKKNPLTTLSMTGGGLGKCTTKLPRGGSPKVASEARKRRRTLFSNVKGHFRTRGRNSTATVRGTKWRMTDTCKGTRTTVTKGSVSVRDFTLKKTKVVKAGHSYFARAPKKHRKRQL